MVSVSAANPLNYWFFLTWSWLASALIIAGTVAAEWRRHIQPLKARDRVLSLLTNFGYLAGTLIRSAITFRPDLPCVWDVWQAPITIGFLSSIYLLRSWRMYFKFELAHERSQMRSLDNAKQTSDGHRRSISIAAAATSATGNPLTWYSDHRYLISDRFTVAFTSISMLIFFVPNIVVMFIRKDYFTISAGDYDACKLESFMSLWQTIWGLVYLVGLLVLAIKLRKTFDAFGIKVELKAVFWLNVLSWAIVTGLASSHKDEFYSNVFNLRKLAPLIFMMLLFIETTVKPVYRSFEGLEQNVIIGAAANNDINTLTGLLKSPEGFAAFQQYLIGCFCVESCLFWKDIEEYRIQVLGSLRQATQLKSKFLPDLQLLLNRAKEINLIYIKEESRLQVNISASQRQRVENAVNNLLVKYESQLHLKDEPSPTATKPNEIAIPVDAGKTRSSLVGLLSPDAPRQSSFDGGQPDTPTDGSAPAPDDHSSSSSKVPDEAAINPELKERYKDILNVFNIAQLEVIELMRTDPYPRFRMTKQFQELLHQFELNQHRIDALRDLNVI